MGLFDKKFCDICGNKIGLFGNRKLEDGNLCKDCASKLSPFFSERRKSTVADIKKQLAYRQENAARLYSFNPTKTFDADKKIYVDEGARAFIITRSSNWKNANPDIISFSMVNDIKVDIEESREEIMDKDAEGKDISFDPPKYEYSYSFKLTFLVTSPYFSEIEIDLTDGDCPDSRGSEKYRNLEEEVAKILSTIAGKKYTSTYEGSEASVSDPETSSGSWFCPACGNRNEGNFCSSCGTAKPQQDVWYCTGCGTKNSGNFCQSCGKKKESVAYRCNKCGWTPEDPSNPPKFCPQCGDAFDASDRI